MSDVRDILGVARGGSGAEEKPKATKERMQRPKGMSREAFALLDGSHPITSSQLAEGLLSKKKKEKQQKQRPNPKGNVVWQYKPFKNQARTDHLELMHWVKGFKDGMGRVRDAHEGDYQFAKYNKKVQLFRYDDEEWENVVRDEASGWGRAETDLLFELCDTLELRWVAIADRFQFPGGPARSMEDLKHRFYSVSRRLLLARGANDASLANHVLIKYPYNAQHERNRKAALEAMMNRDLELEERENAILEQARVVEEKRKADQAAQQAAAAAAAAAARKVAAAQAPPPAMPAASAGTSAGAVQAQQPPPMDMQYHHHHQQQQQQPLQPPQPQYRYPLEFSNQVAPGQPSLLNINLQPCKHPSGVTSRGNHMRDIAAEQGAASVAARNPKVLDQAFAELGGAAAPRHNSRAVCGQYLALRGEILAMVEAKQALQKRLHDSKRDGGKRRAPGDMAGGQGSSKRQRTTNKRYE